MNNIIHLLTKWYVGTYVHLAVCTALFAVVSFAVFSKEVAVDYVLWLGIATWYVYYQAESWHKSRIHFIDIVKSLNASALMASGILVSGFLLLWRYENALIVYLSAILLTHRYFFSWQESGRPWKVHILFKPLSLAVVFALLTVTIPLVLAQISTVSILLLTLPRIFFFLALAIISERKDCAMEPVHSRKYFLSVTFALFVSGLMDTWDASEFLLSFPVFVAYVFTNFTTWCIMWISIRKRNPLFYFILVDGLLGLPWILLMIG